MNADAIISAIQRRASNLTNATFSTAWYLDRANQGYRELATFRDPKLSRPIRFPHFESTRDKTISGLSTNIYPVSDADIFSVTSLWDLTNGRDVPERSLRELALVDPTLTGALLKYAIAGTGLALALKLYKIPDVALSVRLGVYLYPESLAIGGVAPVIPEVWHKAIVLFGAADAADELGMPDRRKELYQQAVDFTRTQRTPTQETRRRKRRLVMMGRRR